MSEFTVSDASSSITDSSGGGEEGEEYYSSNSSSNSSINSNSISYSNGSGSGNNYRRSSMDVKSYIDVLRRGEYLSELEVKNLCDIAKEILLDESNVRDVPAPCTICGDIHGQLFDLLKLFEVGGQVPDTSYVFMGDYVDRGHHGVECMSLLLSLKVLYPDHITLLRGNHESRALTQNYGFYDECMKKYGTHTVWKYFTDIFDYLVLSALVDNQVFCVHGGLSPSINTIDQIRTIDRKQELPVDGPCSDLLWADPEEIDGWALSSRGAGYIFGGDVVAKFNEINNIDLIARAHQLVHEGFQYWFRASPSSAYQEGSLVTVWSAPNYMYRMGNVASILQLDDQMKANFVIFDAAMVDTRAAANQSRAIAMEYFL